MVLIGILSLPTYFSGEPAEEVIEHLPGVTEAFISRHETFALYSLICTELLALIGVIGLISLRKSPTKIMEYWNSIAVIALVNACLMMATANYGGEIRHTEISRAFKAVIRKIKVVSLDIFNFLKIPIVPLGARAQRALKLPTDLLLGNFLRHDLKVIA